MGELITAIVFGIVALILVLVTAHHLLRAPTEQEDQMIQWINER